MKTPTVKVYEKDGRWYFVIYYHDKDGRPKSEWHTTGLKVRGNKKTAREIGEKYLETNFGRYAPNYTGDEDDILFTIAYSNWVNGLTGIKQSTKNSYIWTFRRHIEPYFSEHCNSLKRVTSRILYDVLLCKSTSLCSI